MSQNKSKPAVPAIFPGPAAMRAAMTWLLILAALPGPAPAQEDPVATAQPQATRTLEALGVYRPADFARFAPNNALDMLRQIPGFAIISQDQGRGLGQANDNVLVNGERLPGKTDDLFAQLGRIVTSRVERIEVVDGATLGIPGLAGQVANIITRGGETAGRFEYRALWRPHYARTSYGGGEASVSGSTPRLEWTAAYNHGTGRGGAGGGEGAVIFDGAGVVTENRDVLIQFVGEFPRVSGTLRWDGPGSLIANFNANYSRRYQDTSNDEQRDLVTGVDRFRDFESRGRGYSYEVGADLDFALGSGRMKVIGLERFNDNSTRADSTLIFADASPATGSRFSTVADSGERIGRAEYRWDMLGGGWQLDAEATFNRLEQSARLFTLDATGGYTEIPFPSGTATVTEDRYELGLNHDRSLASNLSLQFSAGAEYSRLSQSGADGLTRTFWRPKGSATLAWSPQQGLDLSLKVARAVGQLSFGDFLASVNLAQESGNAGNARLVPQQEWQVDIEARKNLRAWGSATLRLYGRRIDDYIDVIPVSGGLESRGNIEGDATLLGVSFNATVNLDPLGWKGARVTANGKIEDSRLADPLTSESRPFSNHNYTGGEATLRYDVPASDWAMGAGFNWSINRPYVRLFEVGREYEGRPVYTFAFIEHKDVFGLTVGLNVFNLTHGEFISDRTLYGGPRDQSPVVSAERRRLNVGTIFRLNVRGNF